MFLPRTILAATTLVALTLAGSAARGQASESLTVIKTTIGFGGQYKAGFWNPVWLTLQAGTGGAKGQLELVIPDGDRVPVIYSDTTAGRVDLAANQESRLLLYAKTGPISSKVRVQLRSESGVAWSQDISDLLPAPLRPTDDLIVGIGPDAGLEAAAATIKQPGGLVTGAVQLASVADLPDRWWGYDGVDAIVLTTSDAKLLAAISSEQREALIEWVRQGGRLVLCVGAAGDELLQAQGPWSQLVPGDFVEVSPLRQGSGLEALTGVELPFDQESFQRDRPQVTRLSGVRGRVLADEGGTGSTDRPLIVQSPLGFGELVFVGLDLDHPSLALWSGRPKLLAQLLSASNDDREGGQTEIRRSVTHLGFTDLTGQLRTALDQFPGVTMVNFTTVSILTIAFLLLVGPGDYFLLSRLGWPRQWTWITFPLVAALFAGIAWLFGSQSHGQQVRVNQAEIVDLDLESQLARGTAWTHVYSPATRHFELRSAIKMPPGVAGETKGWLVWQGLPGDALGGLESKQIALATAEPYEVLPPGKTPGVDKLPVQVASSKSLQTRWWGDISLRDMSSLSLAENGLLSGEFNQPLPVELTDCLLIHGERLYRLGKLRPGQKLYVADLAPLNLEARLTEIQRLEGGTAKLERTAWRQDSTDVPRIVQMLMFHESARGTGYTGLTHAYQSRIELTPQVRLGRAILIGRAAQPVVTLQSGDEPLAAEAATQTWTWFRILMPVASQPPEDNQP